MEEQTLQFQENLLNVRRVLVTKRKRYKYNTETTKNSLNKKKLRMREDIGNTKKN